MFLIAAVPPPLRGLVRRAVAYDEHATVPVRRRQAPVPTVTLVVGLGDPLRVDGAPVGSFLAGVGDTAAVTEFRGHQAGVQVDLTPLGAARVLGTPLGPLGRTRPLGELDADPAGRVLAGLAEHLGDLPSARARLDAVLATLAGSADDSRPVVDPEVARAWTLLVRRGGRLPLDALAHDVGWSRRHLTRRFTHQVGVSPTTYARVLRFRRAADLLVPPPGRPAAPVGTIAGVAARCGFADHSHLTREFHALAGCSPRAYVEGWETVRVDPDELQVERPGRWVPKAQTLPSGSLAANSREP